MGEVGYVEKLIKGLCAEKDKMVLAICSAFSAICSLVYMVTTGVSGVHLVFMVAMMLAAVANIIYAIDVEEKNKHSSNIAVFGIGIMLIGLILKVIKVAIAFSVVYFIGYCVYAMAFLLLGLYCTKNATKARFIKILFVLCAAWSIYEFFTLSSVFMVGITWKMFRISEMFIAVAYICFLNIAERKEDLFIEDGVAYKKQIPSGKICVSILSVIAVLSIVVGFVLDLDNKDTKTTIKNNKPTTTVEKTEEPQKQKKSTVVSTVIPAETVPAAPEEIKIGDTIETDSFSLKLNKVELSRRVEPDNPPSYYTYYQAESEHIYIYVNASVTNKEKYALECDEIYSVTADYDGGYEYKGFNIADDNDGDFTYANITSINPLETLGVHCLVDCPQIVEEEGKALSITITLKNGSKYKYNIK